MPHVFEVRELAKALKNVLEGQFPFVFVRGQVSNLSRPGSGHVYFTLKDAEASLAVVWFKGSQGVTGEFNPVTGEVYAEDEEPGHLALSDGQEVLAGGRVSFYPPRGACQLVAEFVQDLGAGRLALELEALKRDLAAKGYFDQARKRPLPPHPARVALITSPTGAAIQDFLKVAVGRGAGARVRLHPVQVQGEAAPAQIAAAMAAANGDDFAEVIVLIRGGGSIEDLWAFNTLAVAEAVFASRLPVVCGVGHEVDVSIADLVADARAATPSHAAQLLWQEREVLAQDVDELELALGRAMGLYLAAKGHELMGLEARLAFASPRARLAQAGQTLSGLTFRLEAAMAGLIRAKDDALRKLTTRGIMGFGQDHLYGRERLVEGLGRDLDRAMAAFLAAKASGLEVLAARLGGVDPGAPLARGYSLVSLAKSGKLVRGPDQTRPGDALDIVTGGGRLGAVVTDGALDT